MRKAYRIKRNEEFQVIFKHGKSFANRQLVLYYYHKEEQTHFRVGLSVGKKIGNAVVRNQVKRYLRQALHELEDQIKEDYDLVIIARQPVKNMDFHEVKKSLTHVLLKSRLLLK
ncbi:ribonuclease P protein component [Bacillaceae bacterium S4-13-58]